MATISEQNKYAAAIQMARQIHELTAEKDTLIHVRERVAKKLNHIIALGHSKEVFIFAMVCAGAKDGLLDPLLEIMTLGAPGVSDVIGFGASWMLYIFLFNKGFFRKKRLKYEWWIISFVFGNFWIIQILPLECYMVLRVWKQVKKDAAEAEKKLATLQEHTGGSLNELDSEIADIGGVE